MTVEYRKSGVLLTNRVDFADDAPSLVSAAEQGAIGSGSALLDDPLGNLTVKGFETFTVDDTDATPTRVWTGYIGERGIGRGGKYVIGPGRVHDCQLLDQNQMLHLQVLRANDAKRPAETDVARDAWLLTSEALAGLVYDRGLVSAANPGSFLEADCRRKFADDVLREMAPSAVKNFFVYRDTGTGDAALFYDKDTAAVYTASISISNVPGDADSVTVFAPSIDAELTRAPDEEYGGVSYGWRGDPIYVQSPTTIAAMGLLRDAVYDTDRIGILATAQQAAKDWLNVRSGEKDVITVTLRLTSAKVNLAYAGQRIQVRFSHMPGFEAATYTRIRRRTARPVSPGLWDVTYELWVPPTPVSDASAPVSSSCSLADGKTYIVTQTGPGAPMGTGGSIADLTDGVTDNTSGQFSAGGHVTGSSGLYTFGFAVDLGAPVPVGSAKLHWWGGVAFEAARTYYSDTGTSGPWTEIGATTTMSDPTVMTFFSQTHRYWKVTIEYSYPSLTFWVALFDSSNSLVEIQLCAGEAAPAPQPVTDWISESLGYGNGTTTAFATTWPFDDGSLTVFVDRLDQTSAITAQDGAAGTFTLGFAPLAGELVEVTYRGR